MRVVKKDAVIITGATGYFGGYFVKALSPEVHVIAIARNQEKLAQLQRECGKNITIAQWDLQNVKTLPQKMEALLKQFNVTGLVNNAFPLSKTTGFNTTAGNLNTINAEMVINAFTAGAVAPLLLIQSYGNHLIKTGHGGKVVNISSMYASVAPDPALYKGKDTFNPISYGMTKASLEYLTKYIASFWGDKGIRCNAIAPGPFPNIEYTSENATKDEEFLVRLKDKTCNNKVGHPKQLVGTLKLLLSDEAEYINGEVIHVDGGWTSRNGESVNVF